jgi:predicted permease
MMINGQSMTIVGVAPQGFHGTTLGSRPRVYVPITMRLLMEGPFGGFENRRAYWAYLFARLKPGVSIEQAGAAINGPYRTLINDVEAPLQKGMSDATMAKFRAKALTLEDGSRGQSDVHEEAGVPLIMLMAVTGVVLLIACANIANLLLARAAGRSTEMAVRLSIGASRLQLVRQLLTESCLLAVMGGIGGVLVAQWTLRAIQAMLPAESAASLPFEMNAQVLVFAALVSVATGFLFGLFPAIHSTRPDLATTLKNQAGQPGGARTAKWFRLALATVQVTLSMALLVMAGLFTKSLVNVSRVDLGVQLDRLVTFGLAPRLNGYTPEQSRAFFVRVEELLAAAPGVTDVSAAMVGLLAGNNYGTGVSVQGFEGGPDVDSHSFYNEVGPGYFRTTGVPMRAGREFTAADVLGGPKVAIVNEAFVKKFNLGNDAVGKFMAQGTGNAVKLDVEIVGVVKNAKYSEVKQTVPPVFFLPYRQDSQLGYLTFYARADRDAADVLRAVPGIVAQLDQNLPVADLRTMTQQARERVFLDRMISTLSAAFAGLATLLAAVGLYGVLAYTVSQRTREFGLRMALGAEPSRVRGIVLGQVAWMTVVGGVVGISLAVVGAWFGRTLLFELIWYDPVVLTVSAALLSAVALSAGFIPALRASRTDPMRALRYE